MTKGEKLIWELFLMVRELMPPTAENTARHNEWARVFHEMEHPEAPLTPYGEQQAALLSQPAEERDIDEEDDGDGEPAEDPHEHGTPARSVGRRKKK